MNIPRLPFVTCRFTLTGLNLERFLNTLQKEGVPLLGARRADRRTLECACYLRDLPRVRQLAGEKGWRVTRERPAQRAGRAGQIDALELLPVPAKQRAGVGKPIGFVRHKVIQLLI